MCDTDEDCPFNKVCYPANTAWVVEAGIVNGTCGCDYWHGAKEDESGQCLLAGPGQYFLVTDCAIQMTLSLCGLLVGFIVLANLRAGNKLGKNAISLTLFAACMSLLSFLVNRAIMMTKALTPELYTACCVFVLGDPRKYHQLRFYELACIVIGALFGVITLVNVCVSWIDTALKTKMLAQSSPPFMKHLRRFFIVLEVVVILAVGILFFVNTAFVSIVLLVGVVILSIAIVYAERKMTQLLRQVTTPEAKNISGTDNSFSLLLEQIQYTTYGIIGGCLFLFISAGATLYFASGAQDWKDVTAPDQISPHMVFNGWQVLGWILCLLVILWFLYKRSKLQQARSSSTSSKTKRMDSFKSFFSSNSNGAKNQRSESLEEKELTNTTL